MPVSTIARAADPASLPAAEKSDLRLSVACAVAREAGALARRRFDGRPGTTGINLKGNQDYLSAVDAEVEGLLRRRLLESFPEDSFFGEEGGGSFDNDVWVVDPIDGTANFVRGISQFCISIAYVRGGQTQIGIIYDPMHDELFAAERGKGATLNGEPIRVSGLSDMQSATIEAGWSTRLPLSQYVELVDRILADGAGVRRGGSGALALAYVAVRADRRLLRVAYELVGRLGGAAVDRGGGRLGERLSRPIGTTGRQHRARLHARSEEHSRSIDGNRLTPLARMFESDPICRSRPAMSKPWTSFSKRLRESRSCLGSETSQPMRFGRNPRPWIS